MANEEVLKEIVFRELSKRGLVDKIETSGAQVNLIPNTNQIVNQTVSNISSDFGYQLKGENLNIGDTDEVIDKATKRLTKEEYKTLIGSGDYKNKPLASEYYSASKSGLFWAQFHCRAILPEDYEKVKSGEMPLWKAIHNHSVHVDIRNSFRGRDFLLQFVLVEDSIESYLRVLRGQVDSDTKQVSKGLIVIKPSAIEPSERMKDTGGEKKELLLDERGAKIVADLIIKSKSYWISPGNVGASKDKYAYMGAIVLGRVESGIMREDWKELFFYPQQYNTDLLNGRFIFKAFSKPRPLWWMFKAYKTSDPANPFCEIDSGNFDVLPAERLKYFKKEDYPKWKDRKEYC